MLLKELAFKAKSTLENRFCDFSQSGYVFRFYTYPKPFFAILEHFLFN